MSYKIELINYRRSKASDTMKDAKILYETKSFLSDANLIYCALFKE